jgi:hypothetical protein
MEAAANNPLVSNELYVRNMAALLRVDPHLAQRIDECPSTSGVLVEPSRKGAPTCAVTTGDRPLYLHSKIDPLDEARRWAEKVEVGEDFCYYVSGFGLGHHIKALHARLKGDAFILVAEPNLELLRAAFATIDLADVFANGKCVLLTTTEISALQDCLEPFNTLIMMGTQLLAHPPSERVAGEFHAHMRKFMADHMTYCRMSLVTLVANSRITCRNLFNNLPAYVCTPPIDILRDRFKGLPGIIVSAGPSLRRNIDQLAALQGRVVIIAVQTTFRMLLERGIRPDFVTSLDYHEMSKRFFEGIPDLGTVQLVAEPKATWHVIDAYHGRMSLLDNSFARLCVGDELAARGGLKAGATVAHLAYYLAVHLGCDPIVLLGQDLGYSDHVYYVPGVAMHDTWRPELNRFNTMEMREWERIVRARDILMKVKDIHGQDIYTDEQLFTYLQQFEGDFGQMPGRVIDATEGGVRKSGTRVMPLREVAERYCGQAIPPERYAYRDEVKWLDSSRLEPARKELEARQAEADDLKDSCERMLKLLNELIGLTGRPEVFNRRLAEVDALRVKVRAQDRVYRMVTALSQHAELQRFRADRQLGLTDLTGADRAKRQLERDVRFVEAVLEGTEALRELLKESLGRFDEAMKKGKS